jgi:hypothetical protein
MNKKDYIRAVEIVQMIKPAACGSHKFTVENSFVELFKTNKNFDETKFRQACR